VLNAVPDWFLCNTRENDYYYTEANAQSGKAPRK
jgi:hypothetical protein